MSGTAFAIGVDIGGGSTKIGLVSSEGEIVDRARLVVAADDSADRIVDRYATAIAGLIERAPSRPIGIGIGFPGRVHPDNMSGDLGNIPELDDMPLAERLGAAFTMPARMENDATAAGLAEATFGRDKGARRLLLIAAGTGIGIALTVDGVPFVTTGGGLGNAGQLIVNHHAPKRCRQGCLGCLESVASGDALNNEAADFARDHPDSMIARRSAALGRNADASDIIHCAHAGDEAAIGMLAEAGRWIGRSAASWAHIFGPDVILLGGGLSAAGNLLLAPIEKEARLYGLDLYLRDVRFSLASLGNDAGMIGAAAQIFLQARAVQG